MATFAKKSFDKFFRNGHERTLKAKKNIFISLFLKGGSIIIGLVLIPLTINYVDPSQYGIWLSLSSIIGWFSFFDIGLGNGLKNKLAEANANGQNHKAKIYISTTYGLLTIISSVLFIAFFLLNHFVNWNSILTSYDLNTIALVVFGFFCLQFIIQIINTVLTAFHEPSKVSVIYLVGQAICLAIMFVLTKIATGSLLILVCILAGIPIFAQLLFSIFYYKTSYKEYSPTAKLVDFKYAKNLLGTGGIFFVIQIGALVLFQTDNIIITQLFGPQKVTTFNVAYKLFSALILVFNIIITPFWSASTDAYAKGDMTWIKNILSTMYKLWAVICVASLIVLLISPFVFHIWLSNKVVVPLTLSLAMTFYVSVYVWQTIHVYLLNGIGKIRLQLYLVIVGAVINLPLGIYWGKKWGLAGITLSNAVIFLIMGAIFYIQTNKIVDGTAKGIWNK